MVIGNVSIKYEAIRFLNYGRFLDESLRLIPQNQLIEISQATGSKIKIGFLSDVVGVIQLLIF